MKTHLKASYWLLLAVSIAAVTIGGNFVRGRAENIGENITPPIFNGTQKTNSSDPNDGSDSLLKSFKRVRAFEKILTDDPASSPTEEARFRQQSKLTASDGMSDDNFGVSVSLSGDTAVIGAFHDDVGTNIDQGSAYVFVRSGTTWTFQQKLTASDGAAGDCFGSSVAVTSVTTPSQTVILVGAFGNDAGGQPNKGAVYVFVRSATGTTWSAQGKLTASDGVANDAFGASVALSGSFAIIGANGVDIGNNVSQGAAYIFVRSGTAWIEEQKLTQTAGSGAAPRANFGWSVGISGTRAIVGTNYDTSNDGRFSIYERVTNGNTWVLKIFSGPISNNSKLGYSVAISGDTAVVGAFQTDIGSKDDQGEVKVFSRSSGSWVAGPTLRASDGASFDWFGYSVAVSGNTIVVGAQAADVTGPNTDQGAVYVFSNIGSTWAQQKRYTASDLGNGDFFSWSVAISGNTILSGAFKDDIGANNQQGSAYVFTLTAPFDFDGDGKTDLSVFRPSTGEWRYLKSSSGGSVVTQFGLSTDKIAPGDFTGDGKTDLAVFRPGSGEWYVLRSENSTFYSYQFGANGDAPAVGDYDGDGKDDTSVYRTSNSTWYILRSSDGATTSQPFGQTGDLPVAADYDGDRKTDIAIYRPSSGQWLIQQSELGTVSYSFGNSSDKPVPGDFTGDGKADVAFFRPSTSEWFILRSENQSYYSFPFGLSTDITVPGDYDGDGKTDAAVFRPSNGTWYLQRTMAGTLTQVFGQTGDKPVPSAFIP